MANKRDRSVAFVTHKVNTGADKTAANAEWATSEGLNPDEILASPLFVIEAAHRLTLVGLRFRLDERGERFLDGDSYAIDEFTSPVKTLPPSTVLV